MVNYSEQKEFWEGVAKRRSAVHPAAREFSLPKIKIIAKECNLNYNNTVLDVGAGNGFFSYYFAKIADVTALDFSKKMLSMNPVEKKIVGDAEKLPFKNSSFDMVFCGNLLHHLTNPSKAIHEMTRVSKKYIVLVEPNRNNPLMFLFSLIKKEERGALKSNNSFLKSLCKKEGLKIKSSFTQGAIVPNKTPKITLPLFNFFNKSIPLGFYCILIAEKEVD